MDRRPATPDEVKALAHPVRLRVLRLCLDESLTNKELADRLGIDPATLLHHVRTLVDAGFLAAEPPRTGKRGSREKPYRATGKSWTIDVGEASSVPLASIEAFRDEMARAPEATVLLTRVALRLSPENRTRLIDGIEALVDEARAAEDPTGEPLSFLLAGMRRTDAPEVASPRRAGA